ncbi:MAG: ABC transporter substrate-binding protein [Campylobacterales bacterium]|nr:ABC transporter substrate-binding protein [Campylobacterales bacterium]
MRILVLVLSVLLFSTALCAQTDMLGRTVPVPVHVTKAFSASPPMMVLLYTLAPEKMVGVNYNFLEVEKRFMLPYIQTLPVLGGFFGGGNHANLEKILSLKPNIVFAWDTSHQSAGDFEKTLNTFDIPVVYIRQNTLRDSLEALTVAGIYLKEEARAQTLVAYGEANLARVEKSVETLGERPRKRVFFAQGQDGLNTECSNDRQSEIISFTGGVNVHVCPNTPEGNYKREKITLEKLYMYDPDVIFVREKSFFESLNDTHPWHNLTAYQQGQIYLVPSSPFAWLSRPPSLVRFLGVVWMHYVLYPEHFPVVIDKEIREFYELFLHVSLSDTEIQHLLKGE